MFVNSGFTSPYDVLKKSANRLREQAYGFFSERTDQTVKFTFRSLRPVLLDKKRSFFVPSGQVTYQTGQIRR